MFRQSGAPGEFFPHPQGVADPLQKVSGCIVPHIGDGQGGVHKGEQQALLLPTACQSLFHFRPPGAKGRQPPAQASVGIGFQLLGPVHLSVSSFRAARIFSGSVRHNVYSSKPGSPMLTSSFR